ncbi:MAG: protein kinase [Pirellulales bacterium]|nr:protein kinase [Pirellulales bacterium]
MTRTDARTDAAASKPASDPLITALDALVEDPRVDRAQFFTSAAAAARDAAFASRYRILGVLGQGSMGLVCDAEDLRLHRRVAIKVIATRDATTAALMRRESEVLAALRHPGIVAVYDCGELADGRPYFVMEQVPGESLLDFCRSHELGMRGKLELMRGIARSVGMAHLLSIVHRDLKPTNLRVRPDGEPTILDFGIAKFGNLPDETIPDCLAPQPYETAVFGGVKGTRRYMSPEQAAGEAVDVRSDVYALGLILFEMLTGTLPNDESSPEASDVTKASAARRLRDLAPRVPTDVAAIVEKCLALLADGRYATANELADDIDAYLAGLPVVAVTRHRTWYSTIKLWRRHRPATALGGAAAIVLVVVIAVSFLRIRQERNLAREHAQRAEASLRVAAAERARAEQNLLAAQREQRRARERELATERHLYTQQMGQAKALIDAGNLLQADLLLDHFIPVESGAAAASVGGDGALTATADHRSFAWHYLKRLCRVDHRCLSGHRALVNCLRYSRDGNLLASGDRDGRVRIWQVAGGDQLIALDAHRNAVIDVTFSADGRRLATIGEDHTCRVWDVSSGSRLGELRHAVNPLAISGLTGVALSSDGSRCATADDRARVTLWDVATAAGRTLANAQARPGPCFVAFTPDDRMVFVAGKGHHVRMFDVVSAQRVAQSPTLAGPVTRVCAGPTASILAAGDIFGCVYVLRHAVDKLECRAPLSILSGRIRDLSFTADGHTVVAVSESGGAAAIDIDSGRDVTKLTAMARATRGIAAHVGADRPSIAWSNDDTTIDVYGFAKTRGYDRIVTTDAPTWIDLSPVGNRLAVAYSDKHYFDVLDASSGARFARFEDHRGPISAVCFSRDGRLLLSTDGLGLATVHDASGGPGAVVDKHEFGWANSVSATFGTDAKWAFVAGLQGVVRVWQPGSSRVETLRDGHGPLPVLCLAASPDGSRVVSGCFDGSLTIWDGSRRKLLAKLAGHRHQINRVAISPDSSLAATTSLDSTVRLWDLATPCELATLPCERPSWASAFSPDGRTLATSHDIGEPGTAYIQLWDVITRRELFRLPAPAVSRWHALKFSGDGTRLYASGGVDGSAGIYLWCTEDLAVEALTATAEASTSVTDNHLPDAVP